MALPDDAKLQAIASHALSTLEEHLMTWPELEAYASGAVALVACITQDLELSIQGVYSGNAQVLQGEFLRVEFGHYWVFNPQIQLSPMEYRCRMTDWLDHTPLSETQRANLQDALVNVDTSDVGGPHPFKALLLNGKSTSDSIRRDLVEMLPGTDLVTIKVESALQAFPKMKRLVQWMAPFRFKRQ